MAITLKPDASDRDLAAACIAEFEQAKATPAVCSAESRAKAAAELFSSYPGVTAVAFEMVGDELKGKGNGNTDLPRGTWRVHVTYDSVTAVFGVANKRGVGCCTMGALTADFMSNERADNWSGTVHADEMQRQFRAGDFGTGETLTMSGSMSQKFLGQASRVRRKRVRRQVVGSTLNPYKAQTRCPAPWSRTKRQTRLVPCLHFGINLSLHAGEGDTQCQAKAAAALTLVKVCDEQAISTEVTVVSSSQHRSRLHGAESGVVLITQEVVLRAGGRRTDPNAIAFMAQSRTCYRKLLLANTVRCLPWTEISSYNDSGNRIVIPLREAGYSLSHLLPVSGLGYPTEYPEMETFDHFVGRGVRNRATAEAWIAKAIKDSETIKGPR